MSDTDRRQKCAGAGHRYTFKETFRFLLLINFVGGIGVQPILRTCFNIFANADESKSLDFSDALPSYVIAKMIGQGREIDIRRGRDSQS